MADNLVPIWHKYTLTVQEASQYFRIGEDKLRRIINESDDQSFVIWNGNRPQIKRIQFEKLVDRLDTI